MSIVLFWLPWLSSCSKQCRSDALFRQQDGGSREGGQGAAKASAAAGAPLAVRMQQPLAPGSP